MTPAPCAHQAFSAKVDVTRLEDTGRFVADVSITCTQCGTPFQFMGVPAGLSFRDPRVSVTGCELHAPIQPYDGKLHVKATFEMPRKDD